MPPKKKQAQQPLEEALRGEIFDVATTNTMLSIAACEEILDKRLKTHVKELENTVSKHYKATHEEIRAIKKRQVQK